VCTTNYIPPSLPMCVTGMPYNIISPGVTFPNSITLKKAIDTCDTASWPTDINAMSTDRIAQMNWVYDVLMSTPHYEVSPYPANFGTGNFMNCVNSFLNNIQFVKACQVNELTPYGPEYDSFGCDFGSGTYAPNADGSFFIPIPYYNGLSKMCKPSNEAYMAGDIIYIPNNAPYNTKYVCPPATTSIMTICLPLQPTYTPTVTTPTGEPTGEPTFKPTSEPTVMPTAMPNAPTPNCSCTSCCASICKDYTIVSSTNSTETITESCTTFTEVTYN
jgi:hypothetical protein